MRAPWRRALGVAAVLVFGSLLGLGQGGAARRVSDGELQAVVQAIEDEIYDYNYQGAYHDLTAEPEQARFAVYINPQVEIDGRTGQAIYKLMPHGEVIRWFHISEDGLVFLYVRLEHEFPPTHMSMLTVYLEDETILEHKRTWEKRQFTVLFCPPSERVQQAVQRQKKRYEYSYWEAEQKPRKKGKKRPAAESTGCTVASPDVPMHYYQFKQGMLLDHPSRPVWARQAPLQRFGPFQSAERGHLEKGARAFIEIYP